MDLHTCLHLEVVQTPPVKTLEQIKWNLIDWYAHVLEERRERFLELSRYVVADAYFSKFSFIDRVLGSGFHVVGRLQDDAVLRYLT
ncbi:hypothetical protein [Phocaeicola sp.]